MVESTREFFKNFAKNEMKKIKGRVVAPMMQTRGGGGASEKTSIRHAKNRHDGMLD